jgi:hypothetical protein
MNRNAPASPVTMARTTGILWLIVIVTGVTALVVRSTLIVRGDAAATAKSILASESLFRFGLSSDVISFASYIGLTVILYHLLKPVSRSISLVAAAFGVAGSVVGTVILAALLAPLVLLGGAPYLQALETDQLQALALTSIRLHGVAYDLTFVLFGTQCILAGYLIARSTFIPRILGVLLATGGLSYIVSAFASFMSPEFGAQLSPYIVPAGLIGEGSLCVWLIVKGLNLARWEEQASLAA